MSKETNCGRGLMQEGRGGAGGGAVALRNIELNVSGTVNELYSEMDNSDSYQITGL